MEGNNKIIERILSDAKSKCKEIAEQAETKSASLISANEARLNALRSEAEADCVVKCKAIQDNALANAELELKKQRLQLKRDLLDEAYLGAFKEILSLPTDKYLALVGSLLKQHAEKGETVDIASKDVKIITQAFLDKQGLGLKLGSVCDIEGGVILRGKGYDKNLSLAALFRIARENSEIEVANTLFK